MSKSDLDARPMFNRMRDAIEAHLNIVFTALAISHAISSRTGLPIARSSSSCNRCSRRPSPSTVPHRPPPDDSDTERQILTDLGFNPGHYAKAQTQVVLNSGLELAVGSAYLPTVLGGVCQLRTRWLMMIAARVTPPR